MTEPRALSFDEVGRLFQKLMAVYGVRFTNTYAGVDPHEVRRTWGYELRGMTPEQIDYALEHLPEHPPNVVQFRSIAQAAPRPVERVSNDDAPKANPERVRELLARSRAPAEHLSQIERFERILRNPRSTITAREMAQTGIRRLRREARE